MKRTLEAFANINIYLGVLLLVIPVGILLFSGIFDQNALRPVLAEDETETLSENIVDPSYKSNIDETENDLFVPDNDAITYGYRIRVPSVGINALIYESTSVDLGLAKGVWRMPDFGTPVNTDSPMVLAAHRWGPNNMPTSERIKNLFYNADKIFEGDIIEIEWNGKRYSYVVTFKEENTHITRNNDDLILITCKDYNSPVRILIYAIAM